MPLPHHPGPVVARGAHAEIRLARAMPGGTWLAVKQPLPGHERRVRAEAELLPRLSHPGIVPLYAADAALPCVVTHWLPGGDLRRWIGRRAPSPAALARRLASAAAALDWMAGLGIAHGDIKPANLVLDATGSARLIDFGAGCAYATMAYASPERRLGLAAVGADDVFALAAVVWALLSGRPPFGPGAMAHLEEPVAPPGLPAAAWRCLRAGLALARADRPATASEIIAACAEARCPA